MSVKRYSILTNYQAPWVSMTGFNDGDWVKYEDYAALLAATQWRPIETAPKGCDVWVLAYFETEHGEKMVDCVSQWEDGSWTTTWDLKVNPTHWMPLPKPPGI